MEQLGAEEFVEGGFFKGGGWGCRDGFPCPTLPGNEMQKGLGTKLETGRFQLQTESEALGSDPA